MSSSQLSPQDAAKTLLQRRRARESIIEYARSIDIPGAPISEREDEEDFFATETPLADHHKLILNALDEASKTPHGRVMIFAPPGSAKSTYASVVFPSAYLGREPNRRIISASYGDDLARKIGRKTRSILRQPRYQAICQTKLSHDSQSAQEFALTNGSEYMACGILSGVTGNRAHGLIIDDPVKGRESANSPTIRQKTWDAYQDDLKTRLIPGGWITIIQTRWHEDDLAGRILPDGWNGESGKMLCNDGMIWNVICLQAKCETNSDPLGRSSGEYLWSEWFDREHWRQFEIVPRTWNALYQQRPSPLDGDLFKPGKMPVIYELPANVTKWIRGWDLASVSNGGDWTAGAKIGLMDDGRYIIADMEHFQEGPDERDAIIRNTAARDGKQALISIPQDPGQAGKTQVLYLSRQLAGYRINASPESGDKITRAEPLAAQINVGNVLMLRGSWNDVLVEEMRSFPNGAHDDQIDALSRAFAELIETKSSLKIDNTQLAKFKTMRKTR
jgi:predicted phage terminase large subunit-like protein